MEIIELTDWTNIEHLAILGGLTLIGAAYAAYASRWPRALRRRHCLWFALGFAALFVAESPPLHTLSEKYLISAHMAQHVLMTLIAPLFVLLGLPDSFYRTVLCNRLVYPAALLLTRPLAAFLVFNFIYSVWHVPVLYELALKYHWVHGVEHVTFLFGAVLMWWPIVGTVPQLPRLSEAGQLLYLVGLSAAQVAVSGPLVFMDRPAYATYAAAPRIADISPIADQRLAGVFMKIPGTVIFTIAFCIVFFRWSRRETKNGS